MILHPPKLLSIDQALEFIAEDELTPKSICLGKMELDAGKRASARKKEKSG